MLNRFFTAQTFILLIGVFTLLMSGWNEADEEDLTLNHIQAKGTHNSYHVEPPYVPVPQYKYTHMPLNDQLTLAGVRQFELDVHYKKNRGFYVYHIPLIDQRTTCRRFVDCLGVFKKWSDEHPLHHTLFIFIEPKDDVDGQKIDGHLHELDAEILSVWPRSRILTPDDVRGDFETLREAVMTQGWPTIESTRNQVIFMLLDSGELRDEYMEDAPMLEDRIMFVDSAPEDHFAAILSLTDPKHDDIASVVSQGFIVRTRADSASREARRNDYSQLEAALSSGAQLISTDYPAPIEDVNYWVDIPGGTPSRCNPLTAPETCTSEAIEDLGLDQW